MIERHAMQHTDSKDIQCVACGKVSAPMTAWYARVFSQYVEKHMSHWSLHLACLHATFGLTVNIRPVSSNTLHAYCAVRCAAVHCFFMVFNLPTQIYACAVCGALCCCAAVQCFFTVFNLRTKNNKIPAHPTNCMLCCCVAVQCFFTVFNLRTHWKQLHKHLPMPASVMTKTAAAGTTPTASSAAAGSDAS